MFGYAAQVMKLFMPLHNCLIGLSVLSQIYHNPLINCNPTLPLPVYGLIRPPQVTYN